MKKFAMILVAIIFISPRAYSQDVTKLSSLNLAKKIIVDITQPWTATGITLSAGEKITIVVEGIANTNFNNDPLWVGPEGWAIYQDPYAPIPQKAAYSVIGKIGSNGNPFYIARFASFQVNISGELYIGFNDTNFSDNFGYYLAFIFHPSFATTAVNENSSTFPSSLELKQNYPNPFNPATTIEYSVPRFSSVKLNIYDELGRNIKTLVDADLPAGEYKVSWDGTNNKGDKVSSGVYFYQIISDENILVKKMIYFK